MATATAWSGWFTQPRSKVIRDRCWLASKGVGCGADFPERDADYGGREVSWGPRWPESRVTHPSSLHSLIGCLLGRRVSPEAGRLCAQEPGGGGGELQRALFHTVA